jgi:hypothetical protein
MARDVSLAARRAFFSQQTGEVILVLLDITHPDLTTIRVVNNNEDVVSGGNTYSAFPFDMPPPGEKEGEIARVRLRIDNIDRSIVQALRSIQSSPMVSLNIVMASSPNRIEAGPFDMFLKAAVYDKLVVEGELSFEDEDEPFPGDSYVPALFPGLF